MPDGRWQHDLKNELGIVLGFSQVLLAELDADDPTRADVAEIHAAAQRAMLLIRQLRQQHDDGNGANGAAHPAPR
jgi:signal transduction histidine kinase